MCLTAELKDAKADLLCPSGQKCALMYTTPVSSIKPSLRFTYRFFQALEAAYIFKDKLLLGKLPGQHPLLSCVTFLHSE